MSTIQILEYRVYGDRWQFAAVLEGVRDEEKQIIKNVTAKIKVTEEVEGYDSKPIETTEKLVKRKVDELRALVPSLELQKPWDEKSINKNTAAALITANGGVAWDEQELVTDKIAAALREWIEELLHPVLHASQLALTRANDMGDADRVEDEANALKEAVDRLGDWWLPKGPTLESTGPRYVDGNAALKRKDFMHALDRFRTVLEMRTEGYKHKYEIK